MAESSRLKVVLCWHMHQPEYRDLTTGESLLPWTYLHAIKDYSDMAAHLESVPGARAVVNFSPVLLLQLEACAEEVTAHLMNRVPLRDTLLAALTPAGIPAEPAARELLIRACLKANRERVIERFAPFQQLAALAARFLEPGSASYVSDDFLADLALWYHLGWLGESIRRSDTRVAALMKKERGYGDADRRTLLEVIGEILAGILPRYRSLALAGKVELSVTPYGHPILPLLIDFKSAREAVPDCPLPVEAAYPGGDERVRWHLAQAIAQFEKTFGMRPRGCWPSEGAVSEAALRAVGEAGFSWAATGELVLRHSLARQKVAAAEQPAHLHRAYRIEGSALNVYFRSDELSDLIGFSYSKWHGDDAAIHLTRHLEALADSFKGQGERVVSIIMDGENAWEYFPFNGYFFLSALYRELAASPRLELTTFSRCVDWAPATVLPSLVAGSWVYGTFTTWIGEGAKNRAWEMLCDAKRSYDLVARSAKLSAPEQVAAARQLAVCEGSDWCWWFGESNPAAQVTAFDELYRRHLTNLYLMLHETPPAYLKQPFAHGGGTPEMGGVMRRAQ
ncbi:MAG TPA: glycoside hydrolase family 57 protein [Steroidobacteraceae bacterium]|nr:glycoside hydrolase family 57 protein [Steroidobacteraceae bacterium]